MSKFCKLSVIILVEFSFFFSVSAKSSKDETFFSACTEDNYIRYYKSTEKGAGNEENAPTSDYSQEQQQHIVSNPINLNYRFMIDGESRREAADPVIEYFKGKYYLFASKSGGYWSSEDLCNWTYIPCKSITTIEEYAPTIMEYKDELYFLASSSGTNFQVFKTTNPDIDNWEAVKMKYTKGGTDPSLFKDDDEKVYLYWGCSNKEPIIGVQVDPDNGFAAVGEEVILITHNEDKYGWEVRGENNERNNESGWNEGPAMIKHKGMYYLQYASPGT